MPYPGMYQPHRGRRPARAERGAVDAGLPDLDATAIDAIVDRHTSPAGAAAMTQLRVLGGAMGRVPADATAFAHRDAVVWPRSLRACRARSRRPIAWSDAYLADLSGGATGVYANFLGDEGEARLRQAYPGTTYERLVAVKRRVDPANVFRGNHNIRP